MPAKKTPPSEGQPLDPIFLQARRELKVSVAAFVAFGIWVIGISWTMGRPENPETMGHILGIPTWVFWGVAAPWLLANLFIFWFCFGFMEDAPLVRVEEEELDTESETQ